MNYKLQGGVMTPPFMAMHEKAPKKNSSVLSVIC